MARTALKFALYALLFLVSTLVFMYWTFPMEKARHFVEQKARRALGLDLSIGELTLSGLSGLEATDVVLRIKAKPKAAATTPTTPEEGPTGLPGGPGRAPAGGPEERGVPAAAGAAGPTAGAPVADEGAAKEGTAAKDAPKATFHTLKIDRLAAHVALWDLLFDKKLRVRDAEAELLGGRIEGITIDVALKDPKAPVELGIEKLDALALGKLPFLAEALGVPMKGKLSGSVTAQLARPFSLIASRGEAQFTIDGAVLPRPELESKQYGKFVLSDVKLGTVKLHIVLDEKGKIAALAAKSNDKTVVLYLAELALTGGDIEAQLEERATLTLAKGQGLKEAFMALQGSFHVQPAFFDRVVREKDGKTDKPNLFLRTLLTSDQAWKRAEQDGVYGFRCTGKFTGKSCVPTKPVGRVRYSDEARSKRTSGGEPAKAAPKGATPAPAKRLQTPAGDRPAPPVGRRPVPPIGGGTRPGARPGAPTPDEEVPSAEPAIEEPGASVEEPVPEETVETPPAEPAVEELPVEEAPVEEGEAVPEDGAEGGDLPEGGGEVPEEGEAPAEGEEPLE